MNADDGRGGPNWHDRPFSRRGFLAGVAGVSAGAMVGRLPAAAHAVDPAGGLHGVPLRGMSLTSKNRLAEGRFGVMFKRLPAFAPRDDLLDGLARSMVEDQTVPDDTHLSTGPRLFAGFTFIGQFIDHDITFDSTPLALQQADPDATVNFRTPRYDLDSVYGRGPVAEPQFYDPADRDKLLLVARNVNGVEDMAREADLVIEWKNILPVDPSFPARKPRKIDTKLSLPLSSLPGSVVPPPDPTVNLAIRNTLRGKHVGLPSGQQVAKAMRVP